MNQAEFSAETRFNENLFRLVSYGLVALMMTCASLTLSHLIHYFFSDWQPAVIAGVAFFVAFERLYTYPRFKKLTVLSSEWLISLVTQWIVMLLVIRLVIGLSHGLAAFRVEILLLIRNFADYFLSPEFSITLVMSILIWFLTGYIAELLDEMGYDRAVILREVAAMDARYVPPRARLMSLIFSLGSALIIFTAMVRVNIRELFAAVNVPAANQLGALSGGGASTLLYFMLGLALLSQAQFISLHTAWRLQEIQVGRGLVRSWGPYSLLFLALLVGFVSLLPTHYSLGMLSALGYLLDVTLWFLYFAAQLILSILVFLIGLPFMLFGGDPPVQSGLPPPPLLPDPPAAEATAGAAFPWWILIKSILAWVLLIGMVGFSLVHFLRRHSELAQKLREIPGGHWLIKIWDWLSMIFGGVRKSMTVIMEAGLTRLRTRRRRENLAPIGRFLSLRRLDPRQRVYYFYLALIRRGSEHGLARSPSQTPYEYASTLEPVLPAVDEDIESLTGSFMEARYSRHEVQLEEANLVKVMWERIRRALRVIKRS